MISLDVNAQQFEKISQDLGLKYSSKDYLHFLARKEVFNVLSQRWNCEGFENFEFVLRKIEKELNLPQGSKIVYPCSGMDDSVARAFPKTKYYTIANDYIFFPSDSCGYSKIIVDRFCENEADYQNASLVVLKRAASISADWEEEYYFLGYGNILKSGGYLLTDTTAGVSAHFSSSPKFEYLGYFDINGNFFENDQPASGTNFLLFRKK